jgi:hypothetical protein
MGGGLMQLVAYGAQDIYLTGNPQITFFKVVYRRHTNFSMEAIEQTLSGTVSLGNTVTATISRNGDLVGRMYIETGTLTRGGTNLCANPGATLLEEVELEIGGQRIDKHYGHWLETWAELTESNHNGAEGTIAAATTTTGTLFQRMAGMGGVIGAAANPAKLFIPLQFYFCRNPGLALPLIALQYHEVKIKVKFGTAAGLNDDGASTLASNTGLWVDYIYLDTDERRRFAQQSHEYLIEQLQWQTFSSSSSMDLNFNHPVKELIWTGLPTTLGAASGGVNASAATPTIVDTGSTYKLVLNGHDRFAARDYRYFTRTQVWQHHTGHGGVSNADSIAVYSFALKPEEHQPSGTCNFSRIDNARLICGADESLNVYAVNYNVLRVMSGMGGLAYSN